MHLYVGGIDRGWRRGVRVKLGDTEMNRVRGRAVGREGESERGRGVGWVVCGGWVGVVSTE